MERHVQKVKESIQRATFTGKGDKEKVPQLYASYVGRIVEVLQPLLAVIINPGSEALQLPPMPIVSIFIIVTACSAVMPVSSTAVIRLILRIVTYN